MKSAYRLIVALGLLATLASFWFGSRFTADDAFITWRFGKNLMEFGIWNYNPTPMDLTQSYTNPIYAILSILPQAIGLDVVLFFKLLSTLTLLAFSWWFLRVTKNSVLMLLLLICLPATMLHAYGGLETFLFVCLMSVLLVCLDQKKYVASIVTTLLLFITRPEAWTLLALVPLYLAIDLPSIAPESNRPSLTALIKQIKINVRTFALSLLALGIPLASYFLFHHLYFGSALPNTFYAKSGAIFSARELVKFSLFLAPLLLLLPLYKLKLFIFSSAFFSAMAVSYAKSYLMMDYGARFAFHIFVPIYCLLVYVAATQRSKTLKIDIDADRLLQCGADKFIKTILVFFILCFAFTSGIRAIGLFTYYPRLLDTHGEFGKLLATISTKYKIGSVLIGDAGIAAYHSKLNVLDIVGLGSASVVKDGVSPKVIDSYGVDVIAFYATPDSIQWPLFSQHVIYKWVENNGFYYLCDLYWRHDYTFKIYAKQSLPEVESLCAATKKNHDVPDEQYFKNMMYVPPWKYWRE
jgi:hypothetical protein